MASRASAGRSGRPRPVERLAVAARVLLAALGGYGLAALATAFLSLALPLPRAEAVTAATLLSFALMAGVVVLVFAMASLARAAALVLGAMLVLAGGVWLLSPPPPVQALVRTGIPS